MRQIKVVGFEDPMQRMLLHNVEAAIRELKCECTIDIVHDLNDIMEMEKAQIIVTPALIVDSHILCEGHIWNVEHIKYFLHKICQSDTE
ncbi:MAG TPA: thioredoxin family protein [Chitinispirillaceae bacterium]|nr:thioredoxin family protein [Chitinispirillaceae bacterium]